MIQMANILSFWGTGADDTSLLSHQERRGKHLCKGTKAGKFQVPRRKEEEASCQCACKNASPGPAYPCRGSCEPKKPQGRGWWRQKDRSEPIAQQAPLSVPSSGRAKGKQSRPHNPTLGIWCWVCGWAPVTRWKFMPARDSICLLSR